MKKLLKSISAEPVLLFYALAYGLYSIVIQDMFMHKVCRVNLNLTEEVCSHLHESANAKAENEVQQRYSRSCLTRPPEEELLHIVFNYRVFRM